MALVERLMALEAPRIPVHEFFAAQTLRIAGTLTRNQIVQGFAMDAAAATEYDALAALAPSGTANQVLFCEKIHAVFLLTEKPYAGFADPADVRAMLGL